MENKDTRAPTISSPVQSESHQHPQCLLGKKVAEGDFQIAAGWAALHIATHGECIRSGVSRRWFALICEPDIC